MRIYLLIALLWAGAVFSQETKATKQINKDYPYLESLYEYLHSHPELSFHEEETSKYLAEEMRKIGYDVTENVGGFGVVCVLKNGKGPTVLVRADTDALPVKEETGVSYASTVIKTDDAGNDVSVMHACGHDVHMTCWTGTARLLASMKDQWKGTLVFIAQPAEERGGGAKAMLADSLYEKFPLPDYALALHVSASLETGKVGYSPGFALANVDMVDITVYGSGGHGAYPHLTLDPVVLAARLILDFQTIVSREISPLQPAVVTVGSIHGGTKGNVIPNEVKMELTLRSYTDEVRQGLIERLHRISKGVAMSAGVPEDKYPKIAVRKEFTPALFNQPELARRMHNVFARVLGETQVEVLKPVMGGEDFSRYGRTDHKVPIFLFWLGTVSAEDIAASERGELSLPSLHSSKYCPVPETSIKTGVKSMAAAVMDLMK